ncbi:hypothetical protein [Streptomyces sp. NPDC002324]
MRVHHAPFGLLAGYPVVRPALVAAGVAVAEAGVARDRAGRRRLPARWYRARPGLFPGDVAIFGNPGPRSWPHPAESRARAVAAADQAGLESAREGESTDYLGSGKHDPAGANGGNFLRCSGKRLLTDVGPVERAL